MNFKDSKKIRFGAIWIALSMVMGCQFPFDNPVDGNGHVSSDQDICVCKKDTESDEVCGSRGTTDTDGDSDSNEEVSSDSNIETGPHFEDTDSGLIECDEGLRPQGKACVFPIALNQGYLSSINIDETHVYWSVDESKDKTGEPKANGALYRAPKDGGDIELLVEGLNMSRFVGLDSTDIYWVNRTNSVFDTNVVFRISKTGGAPRILSDGFKGIRSLAVGKTKVYFTMPKNGDNEISNIMMVPKDGSETASLFFENSYWISNLVISPDELNLYWIDTVKNDSEGRLMKMPLDAASSPVVIETVDAIGDELVADNDAIYYIYWNDGITKHDLTSGNSAILDRGWDFPENLFSFGSYIYWEDVGYYINSAIYRTPKESGQSSVVTEPVVNSELIAESNLRITDLVVDKDAVYWTAVGGPADTTGEVVKMSVSYID